jgi:hypothetical protein
MVRSGSGDESVESPSCIASYGDIGRGTRKFRGDGEKLYSILRDYILSISQNSSMQTILYHARLYHTRKRKSVDRYNSSNSNEKIIFQITDIPVNVRLESPDCVDMQVVDLPGFREFALDEDKQRLADAIEGEERT